MAGSSSFDEIFDYIVVGGGTAGSVVASRLSEDPGVSVLIIEAGGDKSNDPLVLTPALMKAMYGNDEYDWNITSVPQPAEDEVQAALNNRTISQPRGRMLGGTSGLNFEMAVYPSKASLDTWAALGNDGWDFEALSPYFRKFATTNLPTAESRRLDGFHDPLISAGESGPVQLSFDEGYGANDEVWMETFENLGLKMTADPRSGAAIGAFHHASSIDPATKTRSWAATAYLPPKVRARANLTILTDTLATKVVLEPDEASGDGYKAKGVKVISHDVESGASGARERIILARGEVVLAAGALHTPQLLELSGIGGSELLERFQIPVVVDNPHVGEHLQDHPGVCMGFEVADGVFSGDMMRDPNVLQALIEQYQANGAGPLGQSVIKSTAYVPIADASGVLPTSVRRQIFDQHSRKDGDGHNSSKCPHNEESLIRGVLETTNEPAFQLALMPGQVSVPQRPRSFADNLNPVEPENYFTILLFLNHPLSRGSCHINSANVAEKPAWDPRYNAHPADLELLARGAQFAEKLVGTPPLRDLLKPDGKRLQHMCGDDMEAARDVARARQMSVFHLCSSAAMLPREAGGVVDARLRVYGVQNLRVVDASVFPLEPLGNLQSTVYAVAERAADILKEDRSMTI